MSRMLSAPQKNDLARSVDSGSVVLAFGAASILATLLSKIGLFRWPAGAPRPPYGWPPDYMILLLISLVLWAVASGCTGVYKLNRLESSRQTYLRLGRTLGVWIGATSAGIFFLKLQTVSRQFDLSFFVLASLFIFARAIAERELLVRSIRRQKSRGAIIVGPPSEAEWLLGILSGRPEWYGSVTVTDLENVHAALNGQHSANLGPAVAQMAEVFLLPGLADRACVEECAVRLVKQGRVVHVVPALIDAELFRRNLGEIEGVPAVTLESANPHELERMAKRLIDVVVAALLVMLLSPFLVIIGVFVKLSSPGPIIFRQERLGRGGKKFTIFKFRTMNADAEKCLLASPELYKLYQRNNFKLPDGRDFRITKLGRFLRATSLDELPQLINVLRSEMSLVGPRPIVPEEITKYGEYASLLLSLKPGMTGNWQINGRSTVKDYSDRVRLDVQYLRDQSASRDLQILVRTVGAVTRMDGAY
jgi:exopolysaccharide biosynthesis polyprenyl glycosylphosphotransferase